MTDFATAFVTIDDPFAAFDLAVEEVATLFAVADSSAATNHTVVPLDDWSSELLRHHVVSLLEEYAAVAEGKPERGPTPPQADGRPIAEDLPHRASDFLAAAAHARQALCRPEVLAGTRDTQIGPQPGAAVLQHVLNELISHAWDLARSLGRKVTLPDELVEQCQASWRAFFDAFGRPSVNFQPEQPTPADASAADRLAAYLGRRV
ncbi:TIGR03086 family metal-binding protein [Actinopolymorpha alba]|uniref:TIGR03086 family metal-binding protein n=1 Tax=Actinopolymorpha alba TaxID=533267 RepID=UPI00037962B8|nr:TIGR03086 family metal-binding protein [Actinopolymorpha alba]